MSYIDGYLVPVPEDRKDDYRAMAETAAVIFKQCGATRVVEAWGDDVPDGKVTDFRRAVNAVKGETTVFSWVEWPDKTARDAGMKAFMEHPDLKPPADMPFDGKRMVFGGFVPIVDA
jgi:uncharacterized protein YbaA (DUF1428 family)